MPSAQQGLAADDLAGPHRDLRLVVQDQLVRLDRPSQSSPSAMWRMALVVISAVWNE